MNIYVLRYSLKFKIFKFLDFCLRDKQILDPKNLKLFFFLYTFFILGGDVAKLLRFCGFVNIFLYFL